MSIMLRRPVLKRSMSDIQRKHILLDCLNNNFEQVLTTIRKIPPADMDYAVLQTILSRACYHGHMECVSHIWYKYVIREKTLLVAPPLLCDIGGLALHEGKHFLPQQLYYHFKKFFGRQLDSIDGQTTEYELLRIKVESFAKGTLNSTTFREKWKVFLEDIDHHFPPDFRLSVRDFTHLTRSLTPENDNRVTKMLFTEDQIKIENNYTLPLLLNMILSQPRHNMEYKLNLFKEFHHFYPSLDHEDTLTILLRHCRVVNDKYRALSLLEYAQKHQLLPLPPIASRIFTQGNGQPKN